MTKTKSKNATVNQSSDYTKFKMIEGNRKVNMHHVTDLAEKIRITKIVAPVLVTEDYFVLDGQHRVQACELLGISVPYQFAETTGDQAPLVGITDMISIFNSTSRPWQLPDYLDNFVTQGKEAYLVFKEFIERHNLSISAGVGIIAGHGVAGHSGSVTRAFRSGELTFSEEALAYAEKIMGKINEIRNYYDGYASFKDSNRFLAAIFRMVSHRLYDHDIFYKKLDGRATLIVKCPNVESYLLIFNQIYNHSRTPKNKVDFLEKY